MIITKTPFRISFFGGGTDFFDYFKENKGSVISTSIDKYCYVIVRHLPKFFDYSNELSYSKIERVNNIEDIEHPLIKQAMKMLEIKDIRLTYEADLPARSGLGTSSSFAVGLLNAFYSLKNIKVDKKKLADEAIYLERLLCDEAGGIQDQIAASFGGFNRINFDKNGYEVIPLNIDINRKKALNENLLMFFTGFTRFSSDIHKDNIKENNPLKNEYLKEMYKLVDEAQDILLNEKRDLDDFGRLLDKTWQLKKKTSSSIANEKINNLYDIGINSGALGGKLLGAGGGGFLLFYVRKIDQEKVKDALQELLYVPFMFEDKGTNVLYYERDNQ